MDITPYVERLRSDLLAAAEGAGADVAQAASKLGYALEPAVRLAMMEALSHAAAEITAEMHEGSVDVRLDGRDLAFVVHEPAFVDAPVPSPPPASGDDEKTARITLRLPESTKTQAEQAAGSMGQSLNTWLVHLVQAAANHDTGSGVASVDGSGPFPTQRSNRNRQMRGWV